ncbi:hypothetical protein CBS101457_001203 [Exobasidium rhododendri]|nr:hypothetical protein CBS101457_001203 [Exobasidium rhododendri]
MPSDQVHSKNKYPHPNIAEREGETIALRELSSRADPDESGPSMADGRGQAGPSAGRRARFPRLRTSLSSDGRNDERRGLLFGGGGDEEEDDDDDDDDDERTDDLVEGSRRISLTGTKMLPPTKLEKRKGGFRSIFSHHRSSGQDHSRTVSFLEGERIKSRYPANIVRNQKYNILSFLPLVLYEQFKYFFNLYFLLVALSQFIPALKIGFLATYIAPLAFVLFVTIGKEAIDDYARYKRDLESNSTPYDTLLSTTAFKATKKQRRRGNTDAERQEENKVHIVSRPSSKIRVGDLILLHKNQRVPADMVLLKTTAGDHSAETNPRKDDSGPLNAHRDSEDQFILGEDEDEEGPRTPRKQQSIQSTANKSTANKIKPTMSNDSREEGGTCFVRTDQLDGETDWKLRVAVDLTQKMTDEEVIRLQSSASVYAGPPIKDIHTFVGTFTIEPHPSDGVASPSEPAVGNLLGSDNLAESQHSSYPLNQQSQIAPLTAENLLWANTVLAAGSVIGLVVYTGKETRAVMNTSHPSTKMGILDLEVNKLSKILCAFTFALSVGMVALNGFRGQWYIYIFRFLILFSSIIPISLRVNLDMGKTVYARQIMTDAEIPGTIVRTSTLPEELGRIEYLLSDKTGTLTQNVMELKKLHMGTMSYGWDTMDEVARQLALALEQQQREQNAGNTSGLLSPSSTSKTNSVSAGAMFGARGRRDLSVRVKDVVLALALCHNVTPVNNEDGTVTYQASSPDEVAIINWTESVGLALISRDRNSMKLRSVEDEHVLEFDILEMFPFTSESKRMGIVIRDRASGEITFYQKGADVVMASIVAQNDWLDEECGNMAREGLRTLVVGRKRLTEDRWNAFQVDYKNARIQIHARNEMMSKVVDEYLEKDLELLGVTGVEDKLQEDVRPTLELLRNAGVKVWMLTGDKIETATCIAISSKLVARNQYIHQVAKLKTRDQVRDMLDFLSSKLDCCLVIDGDSLQLSLDNYHVEFIQLTTQLTSVVACRCSPTQKADVARLIRSFTKKRVCCIGDGGNDVSMIQAADVGIGIEGKEGKQASLAADFSLTQFSHLTKLIVWHGRNSYKRSAKLAQFVIHRGLIISIIQAVFSSVFYFAPLALYQGWLMVGYATLYTMAPVFSLVLDRDVSEDMALLYPELFRDIGRSLSAKTFTEWLIISIYQGGAIMIVSLIVFERELIHILSISFTALILNELIMVALEINTWHIYMVLSEILTLCFYCISIAFLPEFFDLSFVTSAAFLWKTAIIVAVSSLPLYIIKFVRQRLAPPSYTKLNIN